MTLLERFNKYAWVGVLKKLLEDGVFNADGSVSVRSSEFTPTSMGDTSFTMNNTVQTEALATGVTKLQIYNSGATTEVVRIAFGATAAEATTNLTFVTNIATTGHPVYPLGDVGAAAIAIIGVPAASYSGYYALCNAVAGDVNDVTVSQGV